MTEITKANAFTLINAGPFVPSNVATTILPFNERLAKSIPQITLDLINDFAIAFDKSGVQQRVLCLQYLHPWIKNLQAFANPGSPLFDDTGSRLSHTVRLLVDMSMKFPDVCFEFIAESSFSSGDTNRSLIPHNVTYGRK